MLQTIGIAFGAGLASALLYLAVTAGTLLAIPLFYLAALPVMVAGLGWGTASSWGAAAIGTLTAGIVLGPMIGVVYGLACGFPAAFLTRLAMLGRPAAPGASDIEWYPEGRILIWCAGFGIALALLLVGFLGFDPERIATMFEKMIEAVNESGGSVPSMPEGGEIDRVAAVLADMVPKAVAALWTASTAFNLWLAARINQASGRLTRPMPDMHALTLPAAGGAVLAAAVVTGLAGGALGIAGDVVAAAVITIYALVGLSVLHAVTLGQPLRVFVLVSIYAFLILLTAWMAIPLAVLGLAESAFGLRRRAGRNPSPPSNPSGRRPPGRDDDTNDNQGD
ncbi:MAG: hypothetical protein AB7L41_02345 [Flavobacteriaceae bacterium]